MNYEWTPMNCLSSVIGEPAVGVFSDAHIIEATTSERVDSRKCQPGPQARRRVLVVEDNLDSVPSMAMLIRMMGHEVQFSINGFAAIEIARSFRPDVILLDIGLPDVKGDDSDVRKRALDAGCEALHAKPLDPRCSSYFGQALGLRRRLMSADGQT